MHFVIPVIWILKLVTGFFTFNGDKLQMKQFLMSALLSFLQYSTFKSHKTLK